MNQEKFENLVLRIAEAVPEGLNTIKLNKLLWLVDKEAFLETGAKITGCRYLRKQYGPVPVDNKEALGVMRDKKALKIAKFSDNFSGLARMDYFGQRQANMHVFSEQETVIIEKTLAEYRNYSTSKLVKLSHDISWAIREDGEEMEFEAYLGKLNLTYEQKAKEREIIEEAELAYEE